MSLDPSVDKLLHEKSQKETQLNVLQSTSIEELWITDLQELRAEYLKQEEKRISKLETLLDPVSTSKKSKKIIKKPN